MKKFYTILVSVLAMASVLGVNSCTNLDETIYDQIATEDYEFTDEDASALILPVYSAFREIYWGWDGLIDIQDETSDLWTTPYRIGIGWGAQYVILHKHEFDASVDHFYTVWSNAYTCIRTCNQLLDDKNIASHEETVSQLKGYRAMCYYILFDLFRNVPLDIQYEHEEGWQPTQATPQETWDFIISELESIKGKCGADNGLGQFNDATVNMILAKMYMNHNAWFFLDDEGNTDWYKKALSELNEIIDSGRYALAANFKDNFVDDISGSPEVIFGIPYEYHYAGGNYYAHKWMAQAGRATWGFNGWATSGSGALEQYINSFDEDDKRLTDCFIWGPQYKANGDPIILEDGSQMSYSKVMHNVDGAYEYEGARLVKYEIYTGNRGTTYDDQPIFRYADVLLMKAECLLRLGQDEQTAADLVTEVRRRDFATHPEKAVRTVEQLKGGSVYAYGIHKIDTDNTDPKNPIDTPVDRYEGGDDIVLGGLLDELAWEFVAEGHRRQDLIRFRLTNGQSVYNAKSWFCKEAETEFEQGIDVKYPGDHKNICPIYTDFLSANPNLKQNPGYGK